MRPNGNACLPNCPVSEPFRFWQRGVEIVPAKWIYKDYKLWPKHFWIHKLKTVMHFIKMVKQIWSCKLDKCNMFSEWPGWLVAQRMKWLILSTSSQGLKQVRHYDWGQLSQGFTFSYSHPWCLRQVYVCFKWSCQFVTDEDLLILKNGSRKACKHILF